MVKIPRYIDDQPKILFWDLDEMVIIIMCVGLGIASGQLTKLFLFSLVASKVLGKIKSDKGEGFFMHILYWIGIFPLKGLPASYMRSFTE